MSARASADNEATIDLVDGPTKIRLRRRGPEVAAPLQALALAFVIWGKISLGRSFAILPGNRGVMSFPESTSLPVSTIGPYSPAAIR